MSRNLAGGLGIGLAITTIIALSFFNVEQVIDLSSMLVVFIAAVYLGFAVNDGRPRQLIIEVVAINGFVLLAILGLWVNPFFLPLGLFLHGVWDIIHSPRGIQTELASWYPPACLTYDWVVAIYLVLRFI